MCQRQPFSGGLFVEMKYWMLMLPLPGERLAARTLEDNQGWEAGGGKAGGKSGGDH